MTPHDDVICTYKIQYTLAIISIITDVVRGMALRKYQSMECIIHICIDILHNFFQC